MNRKLFPVLLSAVLFSLCACSSPQPQEPAETPETETPESSVPEDQPFSVGRIEGTVYTNDSMHFRMSLPDGWYYASEEELIGLNSTMIDNLSDEDIKAAMENGGGILGVYAQDSTNRHQANIIFQEIPFTAFTAEMVIDQSIPALKSQLESQGLTVIRADKEPIEFLGEDTHCLRVEASLNGVPLYETQVYYRYGRYFAVITFSSIQDDRTMELIGTISVTD